MMKREQRDLRVGFVTAGGEDVASTRLRVLNVVPYLNDAGISCDVVKYSRAVQPPIVRKILFGLRIVWLAVGHDVIVVQKIILPAFLMAALQVVTEAIVFDFDDALYDAPPWKKPVSARRVERIRGAISAASLVIAGSRKLKTDIQKWNGKIRVIPSGLPEGRYREGRDISCGREESGTEAIIGWIGNPESARYLAVAEEPLETILETYPGVRMHVITALDGDLPDLVSRRDVELYEWSLERELCWLVRTDFGIRPLFKDSWTEAKGGFVSVLQFMALAKPVVVTPVGALGDIVEHGSSGFCAQTKGDWEHYLSVLIENEDRRRCMGSEALESMSAGGHWAADRAKELEEALLMAGS